MTRTIATLAFAVTAAIAFAGKHNACNHGHGHEHEHANHGSSGNHDDHGGHSHSHGASEPGEHEHNHDGHGHGRGERAEVKVPESAQRMMGLRTVAARKRKVSSTISLPGRFELAPTARSAVATTIGGKCRMAVRPLQKISRGDALFSVWSGELISREREIAVLEKRLAAYSAAGGANAELAAQLAVKRAERDAMLAGRKAENGTVTFLAEEDGVVEALQVADGAQVSAGDVIATTIRPGDMRLKVFASPSEAAALEDGTPAMCNGMEGRIVHGYQADAFDVPLYVEFPSAPVKARCGERAVAEAVKDSTGPDNVAVPSDAIVLNGLTPTVFVKDGHEPNAFVATEVEPLASGGGWTAVKGIHEGDQVVTDGAYELKLALPSGGEKKAGHFHADGTFHESD